MSLLLFLKGLLVGIGKIIPGVSGALIAISLNIYDKCISSINNFFKDVKNNLKLLIPVGLGVLFGITLFSKIVIYLLDKYYLWTMLVFIGLIIGSITNIFEKSKNEYKNKKNLIILCLIVIIIILLILSPINMKIYENNFFTNFVLGLIDAFSTVVPGISGTAIFMMIGKYDFVMNSFSNLSNLNQILSNLGILIPFILGIIIGIIFLIKLIDYLFRKYNEKVYFYIGIFSIFSIISLFIQTFRNSYDLLSILIGLILLIISYYISKKINSKK